VPEAPPRGVDPVRVEKILTVIPKRSLRDRVLFTLIARTGVRASEALGVHVEDLTLTPDDEHVTVHGKGGRSRTILFDDPALVALIRRYLRATRYAHGPLFRAAKNHICGPLRYASAQELWTKYNQLCAHAVGSASATGATARPATPDRPARTGPAARRVGAATP
jgi:integrase/recombinase XerC/integrase/recombinase XerD